MHTRRIARGARWMDRHFPGWETRVDEEALDPDSNRDCVVGQETGDFIAYTCARFMVPKSLSYKKLALALPQFWVATAWVFRCGFDRIDESGQEWREAWTQEIRARRLRAQREVEARRLRVDWAESFEDQAVTFPKEWVREEVLSGR